MILDPSMRADTRRWSAPTLVPLAIWSLVVLVFTTGPLYRVRTWWSYEDPLAADAVVIAAQVGVGAVAAVVLARRRSRGLLRRPVVSTAVFLVVWLVATTLWSDASTTTVRETVLVGVAVLVGAAAAVALDERRLVVGLWVGIQVGLGWSAIWIALLRPGTQDDGGRWTGIYFNPNSLGMIAALGIAVSLAVLAFAWSGGRRAWTVPVVVAAIGADLWLLLGSETRTALVALAAAAAVAVAAVVVRRTVVDTDRATVRVTVVVGGVVVLLAGVVAWLGRSWVFERVGQPSDLTGRTELWDVALDWAGRRPLIGWGYLAPWSDPEFVADVAASGRRLVGSAHNSFVEVYLGAGLVGLVLVLALVALLWGSTATRALAGSQPSDLWPLALLVFVVVEHLAETLLVSTQITVVILGVLIGMSATAEPAAPSDRDLVGIEHGG